jgi:hypothetical protein
MIALYKLIDDYIGPRSLCKIEDFTSYDKQPIFLFRMHDHILIYAGHEIQLCDSGNYTYTPWMANDVRSVASRRWCKNLLTLIWHGLSILIEGKYENLWDELRAFISLWRTASPTNLGPDPADVHFRYRNTILFPHDSYDIVNISVTHDTVQTIALIKNGEIQVSIYADGNGINRPISDNKQLEMYHNSNGVTSQRLFDVETSSLSTPWVCSEMSHTTHDKLYTIIHEHHLALLSQYSVDQLGRNFQGISLAVSEKYALAAHAAALGKSPKTLFVDLSPNTLATATQTMLDCVSTCCRGHSSRSWKGIVYH